MKTQMKKETFENFSFVVVGFLTFLGGFIAGSVIESGGKNDQAVKAGVAEYYLDGNYDKKFRYKSREPVIEFWSFGQSPDGYHGGEPETPKKKKAHDKSNASSVDRFRT